MSTEVLALVLLAAAVVLFIATHIRPLNEGEVRQLSSKRRKKQIARYFYFYSGEHNVNKEFKKRMNPNGKYYQLSESLHSWPAIAAGLLKYKKHEWILISFESNQIVNITWMNKGFDRSAVSPYIDEHDTLSKAKATNSTSVLVFHNHPNPDPSSYSMTSPSTADLDFAERWSDLLVSQGINLIEFVCERGIHYEYYRGIANEFLPLIDFQAQVDNTNDKSKWINLNLHCERIF
jgi:hypothetical protein